MIQVTPSSSAAVPAHVCGRCRAPVSPSSFFASRATKACFSKPRKGWPLWATTAFKSQPPSSSAAKTTAFWHPSNCAKWALHWAPPCSSPRAATPPRPDLGCLGRRAKRPRPRAGRHPRRPNHRQSSCIHRRRATSHCPSRARQHRHLGRHPRQTRNRLRLHPHRPKQERSERNPTRMSEVQAFVEKPNLKPLLKATSSEGGYYWNAGMFVLKASVWLAAIEQFAPDILQATRTAWAARKTDGAFVRPGKAEFEAIPSESVDYAVMEHCPGSAFPSKWCRSMLAGTTWAHGTPCGKSSPKTHQGNAHVGDVLHTDSHNTLVHASSRLVALVGVSDLVVVETADAVLVTSKSRSQDVKHIVTNSQRKSAKSKPCTAKCTALGAGTTASTKAAASRSSASRSSPRPA
jgi:hypothetical protein